jgi:pimeloyl-ACP methyl ester carboxylesterase
MSALPLDYVLSATRYLQFRLKSPAARPNVRLLETPLARVRVLNTGSGGQIVVFLCDGPAVIEHYDELLALAPPQMRIIVVEMPGFGFSYPRRGYNYSLQHQSVVLSCVLELLGATGTCLVARCVTAYAALTLCELRLNRVASLCVIQAPCWAEERRWASESTTPIC